MGHRVKRISLIAALVILLTGCSPRLSPLYRDYEVDVEAAAADMESADEQAAVIDRIKEGLREAGWTIGESVTPNVVAAEPRQFREWGLYSIEVELEVAPVGGNYVRLFVHPYRIYFTGAKRKIPYLRGSLARSVLKDLHESFEAQGLEHIGTAQTRDRATVRGD